ncbi:MAG: calcineurin-like phosphoesterase C-terminal domain-containing protein [Paludibacter sp.]|nr:calcineurin-like phosphoesterase C-terminal domain-containing protein [Paludibacter sp.]
MNLIKFVSLFVFVCGLYTTGLSAKTASVTFTVTGKVSTPENVGIADVVVSDGYQVTRTNSVGQYSLISNNLAKHIFISVPADCKVPHERNIPRFYKAIKGTTTNITVNFTLTKQEKDEHIVLTVMADPQAQIAADMKRFAAEAIPHIEWLKNTYPRDVTFIGMTAGDLLWDAPAMYPDYVKAFEKLSFPFYQVIGNHDYDEKVTGNDYESSHIYESYFGPVYYSYNRGDCHFVALDNIIYNTRQDYKTEISQEQLNWLQQDLSFVDKNKLIIVGMHAPAFKRGGVAGLTNFSKLSDLLKGYKVVFFSGHTHRMNKTVISNDMVEYTLSPTMGNSWAGDINVDGCPNGYGVFEIQGNQLVSHYFMSTKRNPDYQFNLYPIGSVQNFTNNIVANVWNYSQGWKVEVYEGDVFKGNMINTSGYDPIAYDYYIGPAKPTRKPSLEPATTPTLFYYTPKDKQAEIKVVVTDNFGNKYTEYLNKKLESEPQRQVFFSESMGEGAPTTNPIPSVLAWTGWHNSSITITSGDCPNQPDVRATVVSAGASPTYPECSGSNNVYFMAEEPGAERGFAMNGIDASDFKNIQLSFGYSKTITDARSDLDVYYWNGTAWVQLFFLFNEIFESAGWYRSPLINLPEDAEIKDLRLRFVKPATTSNSIRIDDVWLTGEPKISASPVINDASDVNSTSFSVSWEAYPNANDYLLDVSENANFSVVTDSTIVAAWTFPVAYVAGTVAKPNIFTPNNENMFISCTATGNATNSIPYGAGEGTESSPFAVSSTGWENGVYKKHFRVDVNTTGFYGLTLSSWIYSSGNGPKNMKVQYRLSENHAWIDVPNSDLVMPNAAYGTTSILTDLALPSACDNQEKVSVRWTMTSSLRTSGASAYIVTSGGTSRISNIFVKGMAGDVIPGYQSLAVIGTSHVVTGVEVDKTYYYRVRATDGAYVSNASETKQVTTSLTTVESVFSQNDVQIYYNPLTDSFYLKTASNVATLSLKVSDLSGRTLDAVKLSNSERSFSAKNLPAGVYVVTLSFESQTFNYKCVKLM